MIRHILVFLFFLAVSPLAYSEEPPQKITSDINLYGVAFSYAAPPWVKNTEDILKGSKHYKNQKGPNFIRESIPADQTFETWKTMYAVRAYHSKKNMSLSTWENQTLNIFKITCLGYYFDYLEVHSNVSLIKVICPKNTGSTKNGYSKNTGEISLFAFLKNGNVLISHYIEWRGKSFHINDQKSWPVDKKQLDKAILDIKKSTAFNSKTLNLVGFNIEEK